MLFRSRVLLDVLGEDVKLYHYASQRARQLLVADRCCSPDSTDTGGVAALRLAPGDSPGDVARTRDRRHTGRETVNVLPAPGRIATVMSPPCRRVSARAR